MKTPPTIHLSLADMRARLQWHAYRAAEALGWAGRLGLVMCLATVVFYIAVLTPKQDALLQAQAVNTSSVAPHKQAPQQLAMQDLQAYLAQFPAETERANKINAMMALAKQSKLLLDEVTYKSKQAAPHMLSHTTVEFTLLASYPKIYQYIDALLVEMPFVALDALSFNRVSVHDDEVEARVRLIFYFGTS